MDVKINSTQSGKTIRTLLREDFGYSSSLVKKLKFSENGILINGSFKTVRYVLNEGDVLSLDIEDKTTDVSPYIIPVDIPIEILYADDYLTVVNKPPYMPAHPSFGHRDDTVANALANVYLDRPFVFRPCNRLDRDTSGAMIVANDRVSSYTLNRSMCDGEIRKSYLTILDGILKEKDGVVETYLRRVKDSVIEREVCKENEGGKIAVTRYKVLGERNGRSLVAAYPLTGRTHQLRVHFAFLGAPILGDSLYGSSSDIISRQALHSYKMSFVHPCDKCRMVLKAGLPADFSGALDSIFGSDVPDFEMI